MIPRASALLLLLLPAGALAADGAAAVALGDRARGDLAPGEVDRISFPGVEGTRIRIRVEAGFRPDLRLLDPSGLPVDAGRYGRQGRRKALLRNLPLPATGKFVLEIRAEDGLRSKNGDDDGGGGDDPQGGAGGAYAVDTAVRPPRSVRRAGDGEPGVALEVPLGDFPAGAVLRVRVGRGRLEGLAGPSGLGIPSPDGDRAALLLPATGPWAARVVPEGDRPVRVRARARLAGGEPVEREVLDDPAAGPPLGAGDFVGRTVLVRMAGGADDGAFDERHGCTTGEGIGGTGFVEVEVPEGVEVEDFLEEIGLDDDVIEGEPVLVGETPEGEQSNVAFTASEGSRAAVEGQEAFVLARVAGAQGISLGDGIVVALLDTGVDPDHPDLQGVLLPGFDLVDGDLDPRDEPNGIDDDGDGLVDEGVGHGTFVAGLVATIAPGARILPVRVLDSDARGDSRRVAEGIVRAVDAGARVVNLSLGIRRRAGVIEDALDYAKRRDVLVVASAGNAAATSSVSFPASLSDTLTVTAVDGGGVRAPFANLSSRVDLAAPGMDVLGPYAGGAYATWSGTSFAAPFASAGAALVLARNPGMRPRDAGRVLEDTAVPVDAVNPGLAGSLGRGRIDLRAAVQAE